MVETFSAFQFYANQIVNEREKYYKYYHKEYFINIIKKLIKTWSF